MKLVESPDSRRQTKSSSTGTLQQVELVFKVFPELNDAVVRAFLDQNLPTYYESQLVLDTYDLEPENDCPDTWRVNAKYVLPQESENGGGQGTPVAWSISTIGGTKTVKQSIETIDSVRLNPNPGNKQPVNQKRNINVGDDGPEGVDIYVPGMELSFTYAVLSDAVNWPTIKALSGKVNSTIFKGFDAGEVLFLGCEGTGEYGPNGMGRLTYKFLISENATNIKLVPEGPPVDKKGHEYLWTRTVRVGDAGAAALGFVPRDVYVEKVYDTADLHLLGIS